MRFQPAGEQLAFASSLRELLADADIPSVARAWAAGDVAPSRKLWTRLADQGVLALGLSGEHGGFGATAIDLVLAFEQLGRAAVPGPYVESVAVLPELLRGTREAHRLAAIGAGELMATVALPPQVPFALDAAAADAVYIVRDGGLWQGEVLRELTSVDRARRVADVAATERVATANETAAVELGVLATAAQIWGAGAALLDRTTAYAQQRRQFGVPIGSFQAVKHQLADVAVALDLARPLLFGAALALTSGTAGRDVSAAKVACTDAAYRAARTALQIHGAIGYTAEYDLALWLTKVRALTSAWGTQRLHRDRVLAALR